MIPPTVDERDGPENAALSVVAGFAKACDIELRVLLHSEAREVLDIFPEAQPVEDLNAFDKLIGKTDDDLRQHIDEASRSAALPPDIEVVPRPDVGDLPDLPHKSELTDGFIGRQRWLEEFYLALDRLGAVDPVAAWQPQSGAAVLVPRSGRHGEDLAGAPGNGRHRRPLS